ncbi:MAG: SGNH/GDSL hydrolase family protein, partial [Actinomycetes bacterium]
AGGGHRVTPVSKPLQPLTAAVLLMVTIGGPAVGRTWPGLTPELRSGGLAVLGICAVVVAALTWCAARSLPALTTVVVAAAGAVGVEHFGGRLPAVWVAVTTVLATWVLLDRPLLRALPLVDAAARAPFVGLSVLATVLALRPGQGALWMFGLLAAITGVAVAGAFAPGAVRTFDRGVVRCFQLLARALTTVVMFLIWVITVFVPWLPQRLMRWDATWAPIDPVSGWVPLRDVPANSERLWTKDPARRPVPARRWAHGVATFVVSTWLIVGSIVTVPALRSSANQRSVQTRTSERPVDPEQTIVAQQMMSSPWWSEYSAANDALFKRSHFTQFAGVRLANFTSANLNVLNEQRKTWEPTIGDCRDLPVIWMFGGSTVFSIGQRDLHTLPSAVARAAARNGTPVKVRNFGVPGDVAWQENRRLQIELARNGERPDLVVFYDGYNDVQYLYGFPWASRGEGIDPIGPLDRLHMPVLDDLQVLNDAETYIVDAPDTRSASQRSNRTTVTGAVAQYRFADAESKMILAAAKIPMLRFNQPRLWSRATPVEGELPVSANERALARAFDAQLPPGTINIAGVYDNVRTPVYNDLVHTSEEANVYPATAIVNAIESAAPAVAERARSRRCS